MTSLYRLLRGDEGLTLVELLVTVAIMGIAFVAILGGIGFAVLGSDIHRKQATAESVLRSYAEAVKGVPYVACPGAGPSSYVTATVTVPTGFNTPTILNAGSNPFEYAVTNTSTTFQASCPATDGGAQRMWLQVVSSDGRATETLQIIKRAP